MNFGYVTVNGVNSNVIPEGNSSYKQSYNPHNNTVDHWPDRPVSVSYTHLRAQELQVKEVLDLVYTAMDEKGYNPVNQIVGYIMSGDPTYITSHKGARSMIMKVERDELVEELLNEYIKNKSWER